MSHLGKACCSSWGRKELDMTERLNNEPGSNFLTFVDPDDVMWGREVKLIFVKMGGGQTLRYCGGNRGGKVSPR